MTYVKKRKIFKNPSRNVVFVALVCADKNNISRRFISRLNLDVRLRCIKMRSFALGYSPILYV